MFGKTLMIDMYGCADGVCDDLELHYRFLEEFVPRLGMEAMTMPVVVHCPVEFYYPTGTPPYLPDKTSLSKREKYPDKAGCSGWIGLTTSGIQIHSIEPTHFSAIDIFTCGELNVNDALAFAKQFFKPAKIERVFINRGVSYDMQPIRTTI